MPEERTESTRVPARTPVPAARRRGSWCARVAAVLAVAALALSGCGGGGGGGEAGAPVLPGSPSGPSASATGLTQGTINGFGSIVVNGIAFDESAAQVLDDDGLARNAAALKLGMHVEVEHGAIDAVRASARAHVIRFGEALRGPVEAVDVAGSALTVIGQTVLVSATTVFDDSLPGGLGGLAVGTVVEVHGLFDASRNAVIATRIEAEPAADSFRIRGAVAALNTATRTFMIGGALISYASLAATDLPAGFGNGMVVRVKLQTAPVAGAWVATQIKGGPVRPHDRPHAELRGIVTSFTSATQFSVNGLPVDATQAAFPDGTAGLALGALVEVEGAIVNGVVVATKVELEERHRGDDNRRYALNGEIAALDTVAKTLVVRATTVRWDGNVDFEGGTAADLAIGRRIQVKGVLAADRLSVQAQTIRFQR